MATADAYLKWARSQIGTVENPPGSNRIHYWPDIGMPNFQGQPWCAAFTLAGLLRIGVGPVTRSVYVPRIRTDYKLAGRLYPIDKAQPGDQVMFSFGNTTTKTHIGIVETVDHTAKTVTSIDGNTTAALGAGVEWNGGGVYRRTRPWSQTWGVGRPLFDPAPITRGEAMARFPNAVDACRGTPAGVWVVATDGGVGAFGGAPFHGSYPGLSPQERQGDRAFIAIERVGNGYVILADDGSSYTFGA